MYVGHVVNWGCYFLLRGRTMSKAKVAGYQATYVAIPPHLYALKSQHFIKYGCNFASF
jgi:hypothetical protein